MSAPFESFGLVGAGGVPLRGERSGTAGPVLLFLHGFPENACAWREQLRELGRDHRAAALHLRGYPPSGAPPEVAAYTMTLLVQDVVAAAAALAPGERLTLIGHDWGGIIGWYVAAHAPQLLHRLIILNAPHPARFRHELAHNPRQWLSSAYLLLFRRRGWAERVLRFRRAAVLRHGVFGQAATPDAFSPALRRRYVEDWLRPGGLTGGLNYYRANARLWHSREAGHPAPLRVPTLVLWGERDAFLRPENLRGLDALVSPLEVVRFPGATHWLVHEIGPEISRRIRAFVAGTV